MKIYITGIAGFLGSHLAKRLIKLGHSVSGNDNLILGEIENLPPNIKIDETDCCDYYQMVNNLKGYDIVYHYNHWILLFLDENPKQSQKNKNELT